MALSASVAVFVFWVLKLAENDHDDDDDTDSAYGSYDGSTFTTSISSSIYNYKYENGRRYHAYREGEYILPNDELEQERLNLQHHMWRLMLGGGLYTAPLSEPSRVLDLGTGTGIWAIEMADEFPGAEVKGIDLSPIQPQWVPPNCTFHVDDYDGTWTYLPHEAFDFIHGRALSGYSNDWSKFYRQAYDNLKPGGWIEMQEYDAWVFGDEDTCKRAKWTMQWLDEVDKASINFGKQLNVAKYQKQWMIDAGFVDVRESVYRVSLPVPNLNIPHPMISCFTVFSSTSISKHPSNLFMQIPLGHWAKDPKLKELGKLERVHMQMSAESHTPALYTRVLGYSPEATRELIDNVKKEFQDRSLRLFTIYRFIAGRRPARGEETQPAASAAQ